MSRKAITSSQFHPKNEHICHHRSRFISKKQYSQQIIFPVKILNVDNHVNILSSVGLKKQVTQKTKTKTAQRYRSGAISQMNLKEDEKMEKYNVQRNKKKRQNDDEQDFSDNRIKFGGSSVPKLALHKKKQINFQQYKGQSLDLLKISNNKASGAKIKYQQKSEDIQKKSQETQTQRYMKESQLQHVISKQPKRKSQTKKERRSLLPFLNFNSTSSHLNRRRKLQEFPSPSQEEKQKLEGWNFNQPLSENDKKQDIIEYTFVALNPELPAHNQITSHSKRKVKKSAIKN